MNKKYFFLFFILLLLSTAKGTHIVGGEIELTHQRGSNYLLSVKMYVDEISGSSVINLENNAIVGIYDKQFNVKVEEFVLARNYHDLISYEATCDAAQTSTIKTGLIIFSKTVSLSPSKYKSNKTYYIVYENCCRNDKIKNIKDPLYEGMTFYTEFPGSINNNSPQFKILKGDFPCKNKPFTFDFSGRDLDGDSLAYSLATPLAGHLSIGSTQMTFPAPYDSVIWRPGYSRLNQIPGNPSLRVNSLTGILTVTPSDTGLYVFSVNVYEYRNGVRIGMVKRDFQIPVIICPENLAPALDLKLPNGNIYSSLTDTLRLKADEDSCFTIIASDGNTTQLGLSENLSFRILSGNFPKNIFSINPIVVSPGKDTSSTKLCISPCDKIFIEKDSIISLQLEVTDGPKCPPSLSISDTIDFVIKFSPPANHKPSIGILPNKNPFIANPNKPLSFLVYATDPDAGTLVSIRGEGIGFNMQLKRMQFLSKSAIDSVASELQWTPDCKDIEQGTFPLRFIVTDNSCLSGNVDTIEVLVEVKDTTTLIDQIQIVNLITPNDDDKNEYFEIKDIPTGNCDLYFRSISIFNRWGAKIFESKNEKFQWDAFHHPDGLYYYQVDLNNKKIKGWLQITR